MARSPDLPTSSAAPVVIVRVSAAHRALLIHEVVCMIAAQLQPVDEHGHRKTLRNMALVCKALYEPAIDQLWSLIPSLRCLVRCLPEELVDSVRTTGGRRILRIKQVPTPEQWERVQHYAPRVREICDPDKALSRAACRILTRGYPLPHLLPRLRSCTLSGEGRQNELRVVAQPSLKALHLDVDPTAPDDWFVDLTELTELAPHLEVLSFRDGADFWNSANAWMSEEVSDAVHSWQHLVELNFTARFTDEALLHLSTLPRLAVLGILLDESNGTLMSSISTDSRKPSAFAALTDLRIQELGQHARAVQWLQSFRLPSLKRLDYSSPFHVYPTLDSTVDLLSLIATYTTLTAVHIDLNMFQAESRLSLTDQHRLRPLLKNLRGMEDFSLTSVPLDFTPDFVADIATSWPRLRKLYLDRSCWSLLATSAIQVIDLLPLARLCPDLEAVSMLFSPNMPGPSDVGSLLKACKPADSCVFPPSGLKKLGLFRMFRGGEPSDGVAMFLAVVFPSAVVEAEWPRDNGVDLAQYSRELMRLREQYTYGYAQVY